jgi:hypothetical protein
MFFSSHRLSWGNVLTDVCRALKLRYILPVMPTVPKPPPSGAPAASPTLSPSSSRNIEPPIIFDAPVVAKKEAGWEDMLERLLLRWIEAVVEEKRGR